MLRSDASVAAFAACVGFACYLNSVICGFVFDDRLAIIDNADVQHGAPLADVWVNDFWGKSLRKTDSHKSYRPLTVLSFRAHTWWRQGPPEPAPFHAVNAALHAVACAGVAVLGARAWRGTRRGGRRVALLASLLLPRTRCTSRRSPARWAAPSSSARSRASAAPPARSPPGLAAAAAAAARWRRWRGWAASSRCARASPRRC